VDLNESDQTWVCSSKVVLRVSLESSGGVTDSDEETEEIPSDFLGGAEHGLGFRKVSSLSWIYGDESDSRFLSRR
jgi:hypothetical protein